MKIDAVKTMRELRERISADTKDMTWAEEQQHLADHITVFSGIANKEAYIRRKSARATGVVLTRSVIRGCALGRGASRITGLDLRLEHKGLDRNSAQYPLKMPG